MKNNLRAKLVVALLWLGAGCGGQVASVSSGLGPGGSESSEQTLGTQEKRAKSDTVKSAAQGLGITNPLLIAGIANTEAGLAHCWSEASWTCQGPYSAECGGPVLAGAADGPCSSQQGGLGAYQLDSGDYNDTLNAHGSDILSFAGNTRAGAGFILYKVKVCPNTPNFANDQEVLNWVNAATPGSANYDAFLTAMAWCYNGCAPGYSCGHDAVKAKYRGGIEELLNSFGWDYWFGQGGGQVPAGCGNVSWAGTCSGNQLTWCESNQLKTVDCGSRGKVCGWQDDSVGNNCLQPPNECDQLGYAGQCDGSTLRWCEGGAVKTFNCASTGKVCGWQSDAIGNNCLVPPNECDQLGYAGRCDGSTLRWCEGGVVKTVDCASRGQGCGWQSDAIGNNCL